MTLRKRRKAITGSEIRRAAVNIFLNDWVKNIFINLEAFLSDLFIKNWILMESNFLSIYNYELCNYFIINYLNSKKSMR